MLGTVRGPPPGPVWPVPVLPPEDGTDMMAGSLHARHGRRGQERQTAVVCPRPKRGGSRTAMQGGGEQVRWAPWPSCWGSSEITSARLSRRSERRGRRGREREAKLAAVTSPTHTRPAAPVSSPPTILTRAFIRVRRSPMQPTPGTSAPSLKCATRAGGGKNIINLTYHPTTQGPQALVVGREIHGAATEQRRCGSLARSRGRGDSCHSVQSIVYLLFPLSTTTTSVRPLLSRVAHTS